MSEITPPISETRNYNSNLLTIRATSDSYHDKFKDAIAIQKTNALSCQVIERHMNEDKMLETLGLLSKQRYINYQENTQESKPYNITTIEFDDEEPITNSEFESQMNNIASPCKFVVDFLYGIPFRKLLELIETKPKQYVFNASVDFDPATKLNPSSRNGKEIGLREDKTGLIEYIDERNGILDIPSANDLFKCSIEPSSENIFTHEQLTNHYQLFGSYYRLLISKGKKSVFAIIVDELNKLYTFADKSFAAKESGIISITINKFRNLFTSLKPQFSGSDATPEERKLFDELQIYVKNLKKGAVNSPEHVVAKRAGDALQALSCLDYGNNAVFVSHDRLAIWLAYYVGVPTIIYMNRSEGGGKKNRITLFQLKSLATQEQQVININNEITKLKTNINNTLISLGLTEVTTETLIETLNQNYTSVSTNYKTKLETVISSIPFKDDATTANINENYKVLLSYCLELLPYFKYLSGLIFDGPAFNYANVLPQTEENVLENKKIELSNWKLASKHVESIKECVVFNNNLPSTIQVGFNTTILLQDMTGGRASRRAPKLLLKSELFNQTRFDVILDTLTTTTLIIPIIKRFITQLQSRTQTEPNLHVVSTQYISSILFFLEQIENMKGGRVAVLPSITTDNALTTATRATTKLPLTKHLQNSVNTSTNMITDYIKDSLFTSKDEPSGKGLSEKTITPSIKTVLQPSEKQPTVKEDTGVGITTRFGAVYYPNKDILLDDIFIKEVFGLVLRIAALDKNVVSSVNKIINLQPIINNSFIETLTTDIDKLIGLYSSEISESENNIHNVSSQTSEQETRGGKRLLRQKGGSEELTIVNYVNDSVFLFELDTIITVLENINIEDNITPGSAASGAGDSGNGMSVESIGTLDDNVINNAIYNVLDDDDIIRLTDKISKIAHNISTIKITSEAEVDDDTTIDETERIELIALIDSLSSSSGSEREHRVKIRNVFRKIQEIGNDILIKYYNYPVRSLLLNSTTFEEGIQLLREKVSEIYASSKPISIPRQRYSGDGERYDEDKIDMRGRSVSRSSDRYLTSNISNTPRTRSRSPAPRTRGGSVQSKKRMRKTKVTRRNKSKRQTTKRMRKTKVTRRNKSKRQTTRRRHKKAK